MEELQLISDQLSSARRSEEIFGTLSGSREEMLSEAQRIYRRLAKVTHPDHYSDGQKNVAKMAFEKLTELWQQAKEKINQGTYGNNASTYTVKSRLNEYQVGKLFVQGDISDLFFCDVFGKGTGTAIIKISREPANNHFLTNEGQALRQIEKKTDSKKYRGYFPGFIESFSIKDDGKMLTANVLDFVPGLYTLEEVHDSYPTGIDPKDAAWIWRRLLFTLGNTHQSGNIHAAVLPKHILIHPEHHGLRLVGWGNALSDSGQRITAISADDENWYPPEVFKKANVTYGLDLYMGAKCMVSLLGGDIQTLTMPATVPKPIQAFFRGTALDEASLRPQDAFRLIKEFDDLIVALWGPRTFHKFTMPPKS